MKYRLSAACGCSIGRRRGNNEDNFYFDGQYLPAENHALDQILTQVCRLEQAVDFGVFDGMGGQADGQIASNLAAATFNSVRTNTYLETDPEKFLRDVTQQMTSTVWNQADESFSNMGTTAAILRFCADGYYLCNVGDSRIFLFRDGVLRQLSVDHTDEQFLRENGISKHKPSLTQYIGISPEELIVEPYLSSGALAAGDQYLLCSDGLTDMVSNAGISEVLTGNTSPEEKVAALIQKALENGGRDNVTVILVQIEDAAKSAEKFDTAVNHGSDAYDSLRELTEALNDHPHVHRAVTRQKKPEAAPEKMNSEAAPAIPAAVKLSQSVDLDDGYTVYTPRRAAPKNKDKRKKSNPVLPMIGAAAAVLVIAGVGFFLHGRSRGEEAQSLDAGELYSIEEVTEESNVTVKSTYDAETNELYTIEVYDADGDLIGSKDYTTGENDDVVLPPQRNNDEQDQMDDDHSERMEDADEDITSATEPASVDLAPKIDSQEHSIDSFEENGIEYGSGISG